MATLKDVQRRLRDLGLYGGAIDGRIGPVSTAALKAFQTANGLDPDGVAGPRTRAALFPPKKETSKSSFDTASRNNLAKAHPLIQDVMNKAREEIVFRVLDSSRGKAAQEKAFREGHSKAHFGQSAHNWSPAIAVDLFPYPYDWNNIKSFDALAKVVKRVANDLGVPLGWGGDWKSFKDKPHYELTPWREYAKHCKPYK